MYTRFINTTVYCYSFDPLMIGIIIDETADKLNYDIIVVKKRIKLNKTLMFRLRL